MNNSDPTQIDQALQEDIIKRYDSTFELFSFYQKTLKWDTEQVYINKAVLYFAIVSIYDDIQKFLNYSKLEIADRHKFAGYTIKWISKLRPIQSGNIDNEDLLTINSFFALWCGLNLLQVEGKFELLSPEFFDHLMYETHYRAVSGRSYASKLFLIEKLLQSNIKV